MIDRASAGTSARRTRRQLLAGGTGALAAVLTAEAVARPAPAAAADGGNVVLGHSNTETTRTVITNSTHGEAALVCRAAGAGSGVVGTSPSFVGVHGQSDSGDGVRGQSSVGNGNGVSGYAVATNSNGSGVYGQNDGGGFGVFGRADGGTGVLGDSATGIGVLASCPNGVALLVTGTSEFGDTAQFDGAVQFNSTARFINSGVLAIAAGKSSATQTEVLLTKASIVLATIQQDRPGIWVRSAVPDAAKNSFTVHLSKAVPARTRVAWFVVN